MADLDYEAFIGRPRSMLIAPAGYGKSHSIVECLKHTTGKQLILTHTHAGIAAVRDKMKKESVPNSHYQIETINSYAQKYVLSFYQGELPDVINAREYFPFIVEKAIKILSLPAIGDVVRSTYTGLFVDEYQDCTASQHRLIQVLSTLLSTRILGDHLQGIFDFGKDGMVNLKDNTHMGDFLDKPFVLTVPWRWKNSNNEALGSCLKSIRAKLEAGEEVDLSTHPEIELVVVPENAFLNPQNACYKLLTRYRRSASLLVIHPESHNLNGRIKIHKTFPFLGILEAIDQEDFYKLAATLDGLSIESVRSTIIDCCRAMLGRTGMNAWFNGNILKRKRDVEEAKIVLLLGQLFDSLEKEIHLPNVALCLREICSLPGMKCYRKELCNTVCKAVDEAYYNKTTISEAMVSKRNQLRRIGRRIYGRCVGTTLLTKGLEFETVIVLNAHKFDCPKHLYVALTRASKKLIVITDKSVLNPHKQK